VRLGASSRAATQLLVASKSGAAMSGRDFISPDDVKEMAFPVLRHRLLLTPEGQVEGVTPDQVLTEIFARVEVPR
jgi:MoxR-like ATPase